jgi:hypothetical protein
MKKAIIMFKIYVTTYDMTTTDAMTTIDAMTTTDDMTTTDAVTTTDDMTTTDAVTTTDDMTTINSWFLRELQFFPTINMAAKI